jgi:predicted RNA methylase
VAAVALAALSQEAGSARAALSLVVLRSALPRFPADWGELYTEAAALRKTTGGALPPWPLPRTMRGDLWRRLFDEEPRDVCAAAEELRAMALGARGRRTAGLYYTPPELAARIVDLALRHGSAPRPHRVLDPCAGAGVFLREAARRVGASACAGADLDRFALRAARAALALSDPGGRPLLRRLDSLRASPVEDADLLVSNPPYGHLDDPAERAFLARALPALRGGEIDRYAGFLLRSVQLVVPGGTAALLVPDTWMTNARASALRSAMLDSAEIVAVADLGKPFAAAKDTRVQAVVLVRRRRARGRPTRVYRSGTALAPVPENELRQKAARGWQIYRSRGERRLCAAIESVSVPLSEVCEVGYGLRTGDNARFVARRPAREGEIALCGGEDILPYSLRLRPKALREPTTGLRALALRQIGKERIAVQRIRTNSQKPWARWLEAAPVPAQIACLDSLSTLTCDDGERLGALLALLQSVPLQRWHRLRTTDVNVKPSALRELPVPRALLDPAAARTLSDLSRKRASDESHDRVIDACAYRLFGLEGRLVEEVEREFWGTLFPERFHALQEECRTLPLA